MIGEKNYIILERESNKVLYQNLFCRVFDLQIILNWYKNFRSLKMTSSVNLKRVIKIARWCCGTKISKTNLKAIISPLVTRPRGARGVKKSGRPNWRQPWWVEALRFSPNWIEFKKPSENRVSLKIFVQFWQFFTVSLILAES